MNTGKTIGNKDTNQEMILGVKMMKSIRGNNQEQEA